MLFGPASRPRAVHAATVPDTFIVEHGAIITALMVLMFGVTVAYTLWVVVLDYREAREDARCPECDGYGFVERDPDWGMVSAEDCAWCAGTGKRSGTMRATSHDGGNA